jgi:hypothetical protein
MDKAAEMYRGHCQIRPLRPLWPAGANEHRGGARKAEGLPTGRAGLRNRRRTVTAPSPRWPPPLFTRPPWPGASRRAKPITTRAPPARPSPPSTILSRFIPMTARIRRRTENHRHAEIGAGARQFLHRPVLRKAQVLGRGPHLLQRTGAQCRRHALADQARQRIVAIQARSTKVDGRNASFNQLRRWLPALLARRLAGCAGYHLGPSNGLPAGSRSVQVLPFVNHTREPRITEYLGASMRRQFQQDGTFPPDQPARRTFW